jgi:hypothetical protein
MSYLRKGLRQTQFKNVIERDFVPKKEIVTKQYSMMSPVERTLFKKTMKLSKNDSIISDWMNFGYIGRPSYGFRDNGLRNYNNCINGYKGFQKVDHGYLRSKKNSFQDISISRSSRRFQMFGDSEKYYHITSPKNWRLIKQHGLIRNTGRSQTGIGSDSINLISSSEPQVWNSVLITSILHYRDRVPYVVLEIDPNGIEGELKGDNGEFFGSELVTMVVGQNRILPRYIKYVKTYHSSVKDFENLQMLEIQSVKENSDHMFRTQSKHGNYQWNSVNVYDQSNIDQLNNRRISLKRDRTEKTEYKLVS